MTRGAVAVVFLLAVTISCSKPSSPPEKVTRSQPPLASVHGVESVFKLNGNSYILSPDQAGVIDDAARTTSPNHGARRFDFSNKTVRRQFAVEKVDQFEALVPGERQEVTDVAKGALIFIRILEKEPMPIPEIYQRDKQILNAFLAESPKKAPANDSRSRHSRRAH